MVVRVIKEAPIKEKRIVCKECQGENMCKDCQRVETVKPDYLDDLVERNKIFHVWYDDFKEGLDDADREGGELYDMLEEAFNAGRQMK